jgi:hypothetical protein
MFYSTVSDTEKKSEIFASSNLCGSITDNRVRKSDMNLMFLVLPVHSTLVVLRSHGDL